MPANSSFKYFELHEGMEVIFKQDHPITLFAMFGLMAFASASFEYRPVMCRQFLPRLDVRLSLSQPFMNDETSLKQAWHKIEISLLAWLDQTSPAMDGKISQAGFDLELFQGVCLHDAVVTFMRDWTI